MNIINLLTILFILLISYILSFLLHEACHIYEGFRQGSSEGWIHVMRATMTASSNHITNQKLVYYAGGIYSGIIFLLIGLYSMYTPTNWDLYIEYPFITLGVAQILYGLFEGTFIEKWRDTWKYKLRFVIYGGVIISGTLLYFDKIIEYINL